MKNIKLEVSYDGTAFHGFQVQPNQRTIQGELEDALQRLTNQPVKIIGSGRTDAGVHAKKQVCNFKINHSMPLSKWPVALNALLPEDIVVNSASEVPLEFHSRFDVRQKTYRYSIYHHTYVNIFRRHYTWHYPYPLDVEKMKAVSKVFIGEHDFTAFSSAKTTVENKVRKIYAADLWKKENEIYFQITGNGFLYNMVRIVVGTLVEVGRNKMDPEEVMELFEKKNRSLAGLTAPAKGLTLWDVQY
ncbi:tRNA pseudouridine(38-40) synthase TruA [Tepidibacillus infernus]|uniref:tRNA pseudouridine synthase A n=1 Tax=Tepidibacillus decaturensis TaxID=1413211 RepID=A0A135L803_9BACI|nr:MULTISPECIES: tRNA pseudouridine(38-40) synthase TruA [Tepidibacillus]KXG45111.1 tRNA pseudouridine synthase A [Tepidibacillus decaturensis]